MFDQNSLFTASNANSTAPNLTGETSTVALSLANAAVYNSPFLKIWGTQFEGLPVDVIITDAVTSAGTATLTIIVQDSTDGTNPNVTVATFPTLVVVNGVAEATGVYEEIKRVSTRNRFCRLQITAAVTSGGTLTGTLTAGFTLSDLP